MKKSALTSRGKNLLVLTILKNSLGTNLSLFSTLILNKPQMPNTKTTFLPIDKFYMICKIQSDPVLCMVHGLMFIMMLNVSFSSHSPHLAHVFCTHAFFFSLWSLQPLFYKITKMSGICSIFRRYVCIGIVHIF